MKKRNENEGKCVKVEEVISPMTEKKINIELTESERKFLLKEFTGEKSLSDLFEEQVVIDEQLKNSIISKLRSDQNAKRKNKRWKVIEKTSI